MSIAQAPEKYHPNHAAGRQRIEQNQRNSCDKYLAMIASNPLSLKQLARIQVRDRLIVKMKDFHFVSNLLAIASDTIDPTNAFLYPPHQITNSMYASSTSQSIFSSTPGSAPDTTVYKSILRILIDQLDDIPKILQHYLYEFPDVPPVPQDIDVFLRY